MILWHYDSVNLASTHSMKKIQSGKNIATQFENSVMWSILSDLKMNFKTPQTQELSYKNVFQLPIHKWKVVPQHITALPLTL